MTSSGVGRRTPVVSMLERPGAVAHGLLGVVGSAVLLAAAAIRLGVVLGRLRIAAGIALVRVGQERWRTRRADRDVT